MKKILLMVALLTGFISVHADDTQPSNPSMPGQQPNPGIIGGGQNPGISDDNKNLNSNPNEDENGNEDVNTINNDPGYDGDIDSGDATTPSVQGS
jgi:hypothetical protein